MKDDKELADLLDACIRLFNRWQTADRECQELRAEVERLRAELAEEKRASEFIDSRYGDALTNLDRLRAALERSNP